MEFNTLVVAAAIVRRLPHSEKTTATLTTSKQHEHYQLLCAQRSYPQHLRGKWELPGGKVEVSESAGSALLRELQEELQISVKLTGVLTNPQPAAKTLIWKEQALNGVDLWPIFPGGFMQVFFASLDSDRDFPNEVDTSTRSLPRTAPTRAHDQVCWLDAKAINSLDWLPGDLAIVAQLQRVLLGEAHSTTSTIVTP